MSDNYTNLKRKQLLGIANAREIDIKGKSDQDIIAALDKYDTDAGPAIVADIVTPVQTQGSEPAGADTPKREQTAGSSELKPTTTEPADQSSLGGTGGVTGTTTAV